LLLICPCILVERVCHEGCGKKRGLKSASNDCDSREPSMLSRRVSRCHAWCQKCCYSLTISDGSSARAGPIKYESRDRGLHIESEQYWVEVYSDRRETTGRGHARRQPDQVSPATVRQLYNHVKLATTTITREPASSHVSYHICLASALACFVEVVWS
jgi:hypothetical protein